MSAEYKIDKVLDCKGMICPRPMVMTVGALKGMEKGQILQVITNDSSTKVSIPGLCERGGHKLLEIKEEAGTFIYIVQK